MQHLNIHQLTPRSSNHQHLVNKIAELLAKAPKHLQEQFNHLLDHPALIEKAVSATSHLKSTARYDAIVAMVNADMEAQHG